MISHHSLADGGKRHAKAIDRTTYIQLCSVTRQTQSQINHMHSICLKFKCRSRLCFHFSVVLLFCSRSFAGTELFIEMARPVNAPEIAQRNIDRMITTYLQPYQPTSVIALQLLFNIMVLNDTSDSFLWRWH